MGHAAVQDAQKAGYVAQTHVVDAVTDLVRSHGDGRSAREFVLRTKLSALRVHSCYLLSLADFPWQPE